MKVIAFGHISNVGKDTAIQFLTNYLCLNSKLNIKKRGFSSWPKQKIYEAYAWAGVRDEAYYDNNRSEKYIPLLTLGGKTYNQLMIEFCSSLINIHIETLEKILLTTNHRCDILLINDLRRPSELGAIHQVGGMCVRIDNVNGKILSPIDEELIGNTGFDLIIDNNGDRNNLYKQMETLGKKIIHELS